MLGDEVATIYADLHESNGVTFHFGDAASRRSRAAAARSTSVRLTDGTEIPATLAVVGVGIVPNVELALGRPAWRSTTAS